LRCHPGKHEPTLQDRANHGVDTFQGFDLAAALPAGLEMCLTEPQIFFCEGVAKIRFEF
jgi:hypothetical protein